MSAKLTDVTGRVITIKVTGRVTQPEMAAAQKAAGEVIDKIGKARLLVLVEDFLGMDSSDDWGDISFQMNYDRFIERIAVVCEMKWREAAMLFTGQGIRKVAIEHFLPADLAKAREWVNAD